MRIWIDIANAPHVNFFLPLIKILSQEMKHKLFITLRDFNQTVELAKKYSINAKVIGGHGGKYTIGKMINLIMRSIMLAGLLREKNIDLAVSHNSYSQILAGRLINKKITTLMDFEGHPANHFAFRAAHKIIVPESFPDSALRKFGANFNKIYKYRGFKEQIYLSNFNPIKKFFKDLINSCDLSYKWDINNTVLITLRAPSVLSTYHHFENGIYEKLLSKLNSIYGITVIALPRTKRQKELIEAELCNIKVPKYPLDGKSLVYYSDLVISAGGTMNREAAILGVPAYTMFGGHLPAVDRKLIEMGRMTSIRCEGDIEKIKLNKKKKLHLLSNPNLCREIIHEIISN